MQDILDNIQKKILPKQLMIDIPDHKEATENKEEIESLQLDIDILKKDIEKEITCEDLKDIQKTMKQDIERLNEILTKNISLTPRSTCSSLDEFDEETKKNLKRKKFEKLVYDEDHEESYLYSSDEEIEKWSKHKKHRLHKILWKLKYNRIVSLFYLDNLRKKEDYWSWLIIVVSTFTSGITVANNVENEPIKNYHIIINIMLTVSSMGTSLIAAWMKKQKFVEKINEIDKYLLGINKLCEELEIQFSLLEGDRLSYKEFKTKFIPEITKFVSNNPMIPPDQWKKCVREITLKYPELIDPDNSENNKLWPWFGDLVEYYDKEKMQHIRRPTTFMKHMKKTNTDKILSSCCRKHKDCENVYK